MRWIYYVKIITAFNQSPPSLPVNLLHIFYPLYCAHFGGRFLDLRCTNEHERKQEDTHKGGHTMVDLHGTVSSQVSGDE